MRGILTLLFLCALALASLPVRLLAQNNAPGSEELEDSYHYVPPSARQSVEIGDFYFRRKDYPGALSRYEEAAKHDPYYAPAYLGMGKVYEKTGKNREALGAYQKYLDVLPSQKQADEAKDVHNAIRRLQRKLKQEAKSSRSVAAKSEANRR
jgi:tetratricopeptide (TPR) repeat protein